MTGSSLKSQHAADYAARDGASDAANRPKKPTTIFRGGRNRSYTNLPNSTINDPALGIEGVGALAKLLSLPTDWQMHPWEIRKRWDVGRDKYYSILAKLIEAGYVRAGEMIRGQGGEFVAKEYLVFDTPQLDDDGGGSPPIDDEVPFEHPEAEPPVPPSRPAPPARPVASLPQPGFPHAGEPDTAEPPSGESNNNNNTPPYPPDPEPPPEIGASASGFKSDVPLPDAAPSVAGRGSGPPMEDRGDFGAKPPAALSRMGSAGEERVPTADDFLAAWHRAGGECMAPDRVRRLWLKRDSAARIAALARIPDFVAERRRRSWKLCDAGSYVRDGMWEAFAAKPKFFELDPSMPEWHRWREYYLAQRKPFVVEQMDKLARQKKSFPSERRWPPGAGSNEGGGDAA
jgi:hypothetical protein